MPSIVTINLDIAQEETELYAEIKDMLFGKNFKKYALIRKHQNYGMMSLYDLHFYEAEDATHFALKYGYCVERG